MRRCKQSNRAMLDKHRQEYQENLEKISQLTARNEDLASIITEEENTEIIALVRSTNMGLDEFQRFLEGRRNGGVPFPMNEHEEGMTHEDE